MRSKSVAPAPRPGPRALLGSEILSAVLAVALILVLMFSGTRVGGDAPTLSVAAQQRKSLMGGATNGQQQQQQQPSTLEEDPNVVTSETTSPISVSWFPEIMMPAGAPPQEEKRQLPALPGQASGLLSLVPAKTVPAAAEVAVAAAAAAAVVAPPPSTPAAPAAPPAAATTLLPTFTLSSIPLGSFFGAGGEKDDLAARLGQCIVLGAGRPVGSALVALLHSQGVPVRAVDDGRTGFVSTVPFEVVLDEVDVRETGVLKSLLLGGGGSGSGSGIGLDTVFVDMDPSTPVEPLGVPLACLLAHSHTLLGSGVGGYKRVVFAASDASTNAGASESLESTLAGCGSGDAAAALAALASSSGESGSGSGSGSSSVAPAAAQTPATPSVALLAWPGVVITGVGVDVERKGAGEDPLSKALKCLADDADAIPYDTHEFVLEKILKAFFEAVSPPFVPAGAAPPAPAPAVSAPAAGAPAAAAPAAPTTPASPCTPLIPAAASHAMSYGLHSANAAGDAVHAAYTLAGESAPAGGAGGATASSPSLSIFTRASSDLGGDGLVPHPSVTDGKVLRNNLPSLSTFAPNDRLTAFTTHLLSKLTAATPGTAASTPAKQVPAAASGTAEGGNTHNNNTASVALAPPPTTTTTTTTTAAGPLPPYIPFLVDALWWPWRQGLVHGYRDPEPHPVYDPSMVVAGGRAGAYSIHNLATYGVSHASGHVKMRYAATTYGWRFKRGGMPWSSTRGDEVVAVKVIEPRQGSPYHLLALRTIAVWEWAVTVYPRHTWYIRMWDDVFPVVERYLDIANSHDGSGKLAVGRVIGKRQAYLSGGPPGLFSAGWADILRARYGAPAAPAAAGAEAEGGGGKTEKGKGGKEKKKEGEGEGEGGEGKVEEKSLGVSSTGAETCLHLFEAWKGDGVELPVLRGRGVRSQNELLARRAVETHCDLGCEDLVIEWCMRDVLGGYYELVHWWGLDALAPSTINDKGLYECKAMACRRRVIARGDPNDNNPIQMVVFHYVKPWEMVKAEKELYGGPPAGSAEWVDMCEAAQARGDCGEEVIFMPLPEPWTHGPTAV